MTAWERLHNSLLLYLDIGTQQLIAEPAEDGEYYQEEFDMSYDFEDSGYLDRVRMVERGDPDLERIDIVFDPSCRYLSGSGYAPLLTLKDACAWKRIGRGIGRNTHLKELVLKIRDFDMRGGGDELSVFLRGIASNRSIEKLSIDGNNLHVGGRLQLLHPLFKHNHALECMEIIRCDFGETYQQHSLALSYFHSLKEFTLAGCGPPSLTTQSTDSIYDDSMLECLHSLTDHRDLGKLKLKSVTFGRNGSTALLMLLRMKESNLLALDLGFSIICDGVAAELASGLADNVTLK
jgi:hypothetical protein